jgi:hypothetical protein
MASDFGAMLTRLLARRGLEAGSLARVIGVPGSELVAVLDGAQPPASLLRRLAPGLGLRTSDLFLIAGCWVPEDLAPTGRDGGRASVARMVWSLVHVPQDGRRRMRDVLRSTPGQAHTEPIRPPEYDKWFLAGVGAMLLRLLGNRNMSHRDAVAVLYQLAGFGPWSPPTLSMVGRGAKAVSGDLLAACAVVLDIPARDLAALAGMDLPERIQWTDPATPEAVEMIWEARGRTGEQMKQLDKQSHIIRHDYDDMLPPDVVCHCPLFRGTKT